MAFDFRAVENILFWSLGTRNFFGVAGRQYCSFWSLNSGLH
jgi:hypothetical protein